MTRTIVAMALLALISPTEALAAENLTACRTLDCGRGCGIIVWEAYPRCHDVTERCVPWGPPGSNMVACEGAAIDLRDGAPIALPADEDAARMRRIEQLQQHDNGYGGRKPPQGGYGWQGICTANPDWRGCHGQ